MTTINPNNCKGEAFIKISIQKYLKKCVLNSWSAVFEQLIIIKKFDCQKIQTLIKILIFNFKNNQWSHYYVI